MIEKATNQCERARLRDFGKHPGKLGHGRPLFGAVERALYASCDFGVALIAQILERLPRGDTNARLPITQDGDQRVCHARTWNLGTQVSESFKTHDRFGAVGHL